MPRQNRGRLGAWLRHFLPKPVSLCSNGATAYTERIFLIINIIKRLLPVFFVFYLFGCTHYIEKNNAVSAEEYAGYYSRPGTLAVAGKPSVSIAREKDDFIDVDDNKALRKTWPMALFIALLAAAVGLL